MIPIDFVGRVGQAVEQVVLPITSTGLFDRLRPPEKQCPISPAPIGLLRGGGVLKNDGRLPKLAIRAAHFLAQASFRGSRTRPSCAMKASVYSTIL
jgi:hypothetical protein